MTSLSDRPNTALIVIDVQQGVVANAYNRDAVVANINSLVERARAEGAPVVWVQHSSEELPRDTPEWQIVDELTPASSEPIVHKAYGDSFEATDLESVLAERRIGRVVVTGAQTDACVRATLHGAFVRGYDTILVGDAHTTEDFSAYGLPSAEGVIAHTNMYWTWQDAPGRQGQTVDTADVSFEAPVTA